MFTFWIASIFIIAAFSSTSLSPKGEENNFRSVLLAEYKLHPFSTVQDFYKLIYQSSMGPAHMGMDLPMAKKYLAEEIKNVAADSTEPLFQILLPDSSLIRLNLCPFLFRKGSIDSLAGAFYLTSQQFAGSKKLLAERWGVFTELVKEKKIPLKADDAAVYFKEMKRQNFPAVHHSKIYQENYRPSYRVILKKFFP